MTRSSSTNPLASAFVFEKRVNEVLDYTIDWSQRIGPDDRVQSSSWDLGGTDSDLTTTGDSRTSSTSSIFIGGGIDGKKYLVTGQIETAGGRTMEEFFVLIVKEPSLFDITA